MKQNLGVPPEQEALLLKEGYLSSTMLGHGLTALRRANIGDKGSYYHAFFSLTIGLERLMKLTLIQRYRLEHNNAFPDNSYLRRKGHNIDQLFTAIGCEVEEICSSNDDRAILLDMILMFSRFANKARYYNLDTLTGNQPSTSLDPIQEWKDIQARIASVKKLTVSLSGQEEQLVDAMSKHSYTLMLGDDNQIITGLKDLIMTGRLDEKIQGYAVHYVLKIIMHITDVLVEIETKQHMYPYLREFFSGFNDNGMAPSEIRRKKKWEV